MQTQTISTQCDDIRLLNREQTAKRINCSPRNLHNLVVRGELPYVRLGKLLRFIPADVDEFIQSHRIGGSG
jgi:excisionase family DNA binding protein